MEAGQFNADYTGVTFLEDRCRTPVRFNPYRMVIPEQWYPFAGKMPIYLIFMQQYQGCLV